MITIDELTRPGASGRYGRRGSQNEAPRVTSRMRSKKSGAYSGADETYRPLSFSRWRGVLMIDSTEERGRIASSVPARNPDQRFACSSDRKRWIRLHVNGQSLDQSRNGTSA